MPPNTKDQILDAAERLFADDGIGATSLRRIMAEAGLNAAAIHYHFGGKSALVEAVIRRRVDVLNAERIRRLDELDAAASPPELETIVAAYVAPALRLSDSPELGGARFMRLLGRFYNESGEAAHELLKRRFQPVVARLADVLSRALPEVEPIALAWRVHFLVGAMAHTMACREHVDWVSPEARPVDLDRVIEELVTFGVAGLSAVARAPVDREPS